MAVVAGNLIVGLCAWLWANRRARVHAVAHADVRVASLVPREMLFNFGVVFWMFRAGQDGQRVVPAAARQEVHGHATPDHAWKVGGLFYFNPHDPVIWVEKRVGLGYTLNVGNSRAWLLIGMMLAPVIAARFLF